MLTRRRIFNGNKKDVDASSVDVFTLLLYDREDSKKRKQRKQRKTILWAKAGELYQPRRSQRLQRYIHNNKVSLLHVVERS